MITTNVYQRVFFIKVGDSTGTCFTIEIEGKQYIVTARHVIEKWRENKIEIFHDNQWKGIDFQLVGKCDDEIDIAVLVAPIQLSPSYELPATPEGMVWGQDVFFLGFPYGWRGELGEMNRNYPLPFVKKAILSCHFADSTKCFNYLLDGHNNPGFSGGPVVFKRNNSKLYQVASVVSGYLKTEAKIYNHNEPVELTYQYNTGIIVSYSINHAVNLIKLNPIGVKVKEEWE